MIKTMNSHIYFNTKEATNLFNNNPCDSNFLLQQNLSENVEFFRVSLNQMSFPNIVYPINSLNNTLNFLRMETPELYSIVL